ncbi:CbtA family protein [Luteipulveratus sp. YIM 133132]|uniref:CbtA family protein n=1 Tax=Luteipulveratus flavus TaxID=3031728 RepID=UPI0023AE7478|nr:CbtA family protein [Luteipulveratus sp. YIM 133132]MDE9365238.1 CbtA family protein [Luteipulveratus sp. YIM 133132]
MLSARQLLVYGLIAGFVAGLLAFGVARTVGEPSVNAAIAVEEGAPSTTHSHTSSPAAPHDHGDEDELFSRGTQSTWGLLTATQVFGTALGGLAGLMSALAMGRMGRLPPEGTTAVTVAVGFVAAYAVPFAKYPPNPPAVGDPDTIAERTTTFFGFIALSVVVAVAAVYLATYLSRRHGGFVGVAAGSAAYGVVMLVAARLMPTYHEVPHDFPATTLYDFRFASFATQLTLWAGIAVVLGLLLVRATRTARTSVVPRELQPA